MPTRNPLRVSRTMKAALGPVLSSGVPVRIDTCLICRHRNEEECRRYPPVVRSGQQGTAVWPTISRGEWCGEFARA